MFKLDSDFTDFYDKSINPEAQLVYHRLRKIKARGKELAYLRNNGISTVEFGPFNRFSSDTKKLVVYTNPSLHNFLGKHIYSYDEVRLSYSNCVVSKFLDKCDGYTIKYLQVGKRRFRLMFHNPNYNDTLMEGDLVSIDEMEPSYNYPIGLPIYSIDYISDGREMQAVDFNEVQNLGQLGMDKYISAEEVVAEIHAALLAYNKIN